METIVATIQIVNSEKENDVILFPVCREGFSLNDLRGAFPHAHSLRYREEAGTEVHHVICRDGNFQEPYGGWNQRGRIYNAMCDIQNERNTHFEAFRRQISSRYATNPPFQMEARPNPNSNRKPGKQESPTATLSVGHGHFVKGIFKRISETNLSLCGGSVVVGPYSKTENVKDQIKVDSFKKFSTQNQLFRRTYKSVESFLLVYPDGTIVDMLPDKSEEFTLEGYKNFLDPRKRYDRIKLFLCQKANYHQNNIEILSDTESTSLNDSSDEDLPTLSSTTVTRRARENLSSTLNETIALVVECHVYKQDDLLWTQNIPNNSLVKTLIDLVCQRFVGKLQTFDGITLDPQHRISYYSQNGKKINLRLIEERREVNTNETHTRNEDFQIGARYCTSTDADNIVRKALIDINTTEEPTFILNKYKMCFLQGRPLGCTAENATIEGETSPIFVRRGYEYVDAIDELVTLDNIRFPLEVGYYGEEAVDLGGPRTEFFTASINYIKEHFVEMEGTGYTGSIRKDVNFVINKGYYVAGLLIGLSAIQNGPCADFLDCLIRSETWIEGQEHVEIFKLGLKKTGLLQLLERKPSLRFLFQKRQGMLTVSKLINFLQPNFSEDGSNRRLHESNSYKVFIKYLREVAAGRRPPVSLNKVLQFISAYEEEPYLGFPMIPTVRFAELPGNIPTSNTCIFQLTLPLLESANEDVFEKFDLAFMNAFFGLQ